MKGGAVTHIGSLVVETANLYVAARVAKAADKCAEVRGYVLIDGAPVRWSTVEAFNAHGGFERRAVSPAKAGEAA